MQRMSERQSVQRLQPPTRRSLAGRLTGQNHGQRNYHAASSPRSRQAVCTCSNRPGSVRCSLHGYAVPGERLRKNSVRADKEILRRALTPPARRFSFRWTNFRPTPSRLSNMSMA